MNLCIFQQTVGHWLIEVGLDLDHSDYEFEHVSHSHVRFELKDVVLTSAVWRFLVGPILPLTVSEGQVDQAGTSQVFFFRCGGFSSTFFFFFFFFKHVFY